MSKGNPKQAKSDTEKQLDAVAAEEIKRHIKAEMAANGLKSKDVAERLTAMGRPITDQGLRNKISNCTHQTTWYWDLMKAIKGN
jgi:hypothetical protein